MKKSPRWDENVAGLKCLRLEAEESSRCKTSPFHHSNPSLFAALYLPDFELQAALRPEPTLWQVPVALLNDLQAKATILQLTPCAAKAGVSIGMTPSQGLARCLRLIIKPRAFSQEKIAEQILLHHAFSLAPEIEATAPGVCTVHFTSRKGCRKQVEGVVRQLAQLQLSAQAGIASTPDLSFLAACLARPILEVENAKEFLAPLPIETLQRLSSSHKS